MQPKKEKKEKRATKTPIHGEYVLFTLYPCTEEICNPKFFFVISPLATVVV